MQKAQEFGSDQMLVKRKWDRLGLDDQEFPMKREYLQPVKKEYSDWNTNKSHVGAEDYAKPGTNNSRENAMNWHEHEKYVLRVEGTDHLDDVSIANIIRSMNYRLPE